MVVAVVVVSNATTVYYRSGSSALTLLVGGRKGIRPVKSYMLIHCMLEVVNWLQLGANDLIMFHTSSCHHHHLHHLILRQNAQWFGIFVPAHSCYHGKWLYHECNIALLGSQFRSGQPPKACCRKNITKLTAAAITSADVNSNIHQ